MGWLVAGCLTLIAGFFLYKLFALNNAAKGVGAPAITRKALNPQTRVQAEKLDDSAHTEKGFISSAAPRIHMDTPKEEESGRPIARAMEKRSLGAPGMANAPPSTAQTRSSSPSRLKPPTFAAPPRPGNGLMRPPPSAAASLRVPPTKVLSNASMAPTSSIMPPGKQVSRKVILEPGHSPLDWAALTSNPNSRLRGKDAPENLIRVTPARLKQQNGRKGRDAWTVYNGKVYNITPYVPFHPGGKGEILRGAGQDSAKLFMEVHPWVNWDAMLGECLVGILVGDEDEADNRSGGLDDMD